MRLFITKIIFYESAFLVIINILFFIVDMLQLPNFAEAITKTPSSWITYLKEMRCATIRKVSQVK
jgi:hypothetical protein